MVQHLSFDLWLTLIKSNPQFKKRRAEFIAERYNPLGLSSILVFNIIRNIDRACDQMNEISGKKVATEFMYSSILSEIGYSAHMRNDNLLEELKSQINELFYQYQPLLLNDNIIKILTRFKKEGFSMNVSSNTGFIEGSCLKKASNLVELFSFFDFLVFSDEINASKPSAEFYEIVFRQTKFKKNEIIHIGDNYSADYIGAKNFGFNALLIENSEYSIELIKREIDEKNRNF